MNHHWSLCSIKLLCSYLNILTIYIHNGLTRRLAYVGITRAQKELTFTLCKERRQYGELVRPPVAGNDRAE